MGYLVLAAMGFGYAVYARDSEDPTVIFIRRLNIACACVQLVAYFTCT